MDIREPAPVDSDGKEREDGMLPMLYSCSFLQFPSGFIGAYS